MRPVCRSRVGRVGCQTCGPGLGCSITPPARPIAISSSIYKYPFEVGDQTFIVS